MTPLSLLAGRTVRINCKPCKIFLDVLSVEVGGVILFQKGLLYEDAVLSLIVFKLLLCLSSPDLPSCFAVLF